MKTCTGCKVEKPFEAFYLCAKHTDGYTYRCKECAREYSRKRGREPEFRKRKRENSFRFSYGITLEDYELMFEEQAGLCAICNQPETKLHPASQAVMPLAVDHCHSTNKVRGLLCSQCNLMLGLANDDVAKLQQAIDYLQGGGK